MATDYSKDNPFYHNYVFSSFDLDRVKIKWWEYPFLVFLTTYMQISTDSDHIIYYKRWNGKYYIMKTINEKDWKET